MGGALNGWDPGVPRVGRGGESWGVSQCPEGPRVPALAGLVPGKRAFSPAPGVSGGPFWGGSEGKRGGATGGISPPPLLLP